MSQRSYHCSSSGSILAWKLPNAADVAKINKYTRYSFTPLRSEASSSVAWGCLATLRASSEGPPKLDLTAQGISLYSCLNLNNLVLNNNTMVIACMGPKLHLNNVQELTQTNKGQKMHFGG